MKGRSRTYILTGFPRKTRLFHVEDISVEDKQQNILDNSQNAPKKLVKILKNKQYLQEFKRKIKCKQGAKASQLSNGLRIKFDDMLNQLKYQKQALSNMAIGCVNCCKISGG